MADEDAEVRTRVQREAAIKDLNAVFDKHARSLNKVARKVQVHFTSDPVDAKGINILNTAPKKSFISYFFRML